MAAALNRQIADQLEEVAQILKEQHANPFRVQAYQKAANVLRGMARSVQEILDQEGLEGLEKLPGIGKSIARSLQNIIRHGRLAMLDRLRGTHDPVQLLSSVPGISRAMAARLHDELDIGSLEELEEAAHDGRLENLAKLRGKRLAGIRDCLAQRLSRVRVSHARETPSREPPIAELLDVDEEYRRLVAADALPKIAPRSFNPTGEAWLPVLHTTRGERHYTALFSNTARAHRLHQTQDWVVLYYDGDHGERQCTIITSTFGPLQGRRIVRGRESECQDYYQLPALTNTAYGKF